MVITATIRNPFTVFLDAEDLLISFTRYVQTQLTTVQYDGAKLLTWVVFYIQFYKVCVFLFRGINIAGTTLGIAFIGSMCDRSDSTSVTQDGGEPSLSRVITIATHELGHNLNMRHDNGMFW